MRYPGGNFVSGYNWLDRVGPKDKRPTVLERAWNSLETNQFGTNKFIEWCKLVNTEPLLGFNLGTGTAEMAVAYVEYCNVTEAPNGASYVARTATIKGTTCVTGAWAMKWMAPGRWSMTAREYGRKARDAARQIRVIDPSLRLTAYGSSNTILPTYLVWDHEVLEQCYDQVDGISLHDCYGDTEQLTSNGAKRVLAMIWIWKERILELGAVCDYVQGLLKSPKRLWLSFDEWMSRIAPGALLSGRQTGFCAKVAGRSVQPRRCLAGRRVSGHVLRQAERVRVGCIAQIVDVIRTW